ncbi:MAG TPA: ATP-binding protein [Chloroflexota bacterium]|nr:ATP-binding protein [Chloroflexota bacterium]
MSPFHIPSLRWRLVAIMCVAYVVVAIVSGAVSYSAQRSGLRQQLTARARSDAAILAAGAAGPVSVGGLKNRQVLIDFVSAVQSTERLTSIIIRGPDGCVLTPPRMKGCKPFLTIQARTSILPNGNAMAVAPIIPTGAATLAGYVTVELSGKTVSDSLHQDLMVDALVAFIGLLIFLLLSLVIAGYILGPVMSLARAASAIRHGELTARVPTQGSTELSDLAGAFNEMAASLERRIEQLSLLADTGAILPSTLQAHEDARPLLQSFARTLGACAAGMPDRDDLWWDDGKSTCRDAARALGGVGTPTLAQRGEAVLLALPVPQGVFVLAREGRAFSRDEQQVAANFAFQLGIAAENVRLFEAQQEALNVKDQFLSIVSHELRTPLTAMKGYAQMLRRRLADDPDGQRFAASIDAQVTRLSRLVDDLLDVTRFARSQFELTRRPMDLRPALEEAVNRFSIIAPNHTFRLEVTDGDLHGEWDRDRLEQVLNNLIGNAVKYSPNGGEVLVRAGRTDHEITIAVHDQGVGIPPEEQSQVFDRFYRSAGTQNVKGMGLGLYVTRRVIEAHGGTVGVRSEPGAGSEFYFTLPVVGAGVAAS